MEKPAIKISKLVSEADGNIIGDCFIIRPNINLEQKLGVLFGIIEIYNNNDSFTDSFLELISDLKTEYYLPPIDQNKSAEKRFEEALARTNRRVHSAFNQSIEAVDLRTVSAIIGVSWENQLFFSSVGRIKGLFARNKKNGELLLLDVLANSQEEKFKPEPEKFFANISAGELSHQDALIFINEEFLALFSQYELGETILSNEPEDTAKLLDETIKQKVAKKNFYAVSLRLATPQYQEKPLVLKNEIDQPPKLETTANQKINASASVSASTMTAVKKTLPTQHSIDKLIYTQVKTEKYLAPSTMPNWQKIAIIIAKKIQQLAIWSAQKGKIAALAVWSFAKNKYRQKFPANKPELKNNDSGDQVNGQFTSKHQEAEATATIFETALEQEFETTNDTENGINQEQLSGKIIEKIELEDFEESEAQQIESSIAPITNSNTESGANQKQNISNKFNHWINKKIVIFLLLNKLQKLALAIIIILIFLFCQSVVIIGRASDMDNLKTGYGIIAYQVQENLNSAEALNIFNDEAGAVQALKKARELFATIPDRRSTKSLQADLDQKIKEASAKLQKISYQEPTVVLDFNSNSDSADFSGLAKTNGSLWVFNNTNKELHQINISDNASENIGTNLANIKKLTAIDKNNLILTTNDDLFFKYNISQNTSAKVAANKNYFQLKTFPSASPLIDPPLSTSTLSMSENINDYSLLLDSENSRLIIFDKNNILKRQFISDKLKSASAITADIGTKEIWFFSENKIYKLTIDF